MRSKKWIVLVGCLALSLHSVAVDLPNAIWWGYGGILKAGDRHALAYSTSDGVFVRIWSTETDGRTYHVPGWSQVQCPATVTVGQRLVLADPNSAAGGPLRVAEFAIGETALTLVSERFVGDADDRCPVAILTPAGGVLVATYRHVSSYNLDTAYRSPAGGWSTNFIELIPGPVGIPSIALEVVNGPDGRTWIVMNRDSSHTIDLVRFEEGQIYSFDQAYLRNEVGDGQHSPWEPNGEMPNVCVGRGLNKVLISYQNYYQAWPCPDGLFSRVVTVAVDSLLNKQVLGINTNLVEEVFTPSPVFPTPTGFELLSWELNGDCSQGPWRHRKNSKGVWTEGHTYASGQSPITLAWSDDGWAVWRWPDGVARLTKIPVNTNGPTLNIARTGNQVALTWEGNDWILQRSVDCANWDNVATESPYSQIVTGQYFFRLRSR